jgi:predicted Zn-dependent protease
LLYIPSVAVSLAVGYAWRHVASADARHRVATYALGAAVVLLGIRTMVRNTDWKDSSTVHDALVRDHPESFRAQYFAGSALLATHPDKARDYLELAYRTWQDDPFLLSQIGRLELAGGDLDRAVTLLEKARSLAPFVHETETSLAYAYIASGRTTDALRALDRAERIGADPVTAFALRAQAYEVLGRHGAAAGAWRAAARRDTTGNRYWQLLARSLARNGAASGALAALDSARARVHDSEAAASIAALERAIRTGCYDVPQRQSARAATCADPLARVTMRLPGQTPPQ